MCLANAFGVLLAILVYFCHLATGVITLKFVLFQWEAGEIFGLSRLGVFCACAHLAPLAFAFVSHFACMVTDAGFIPRGTKVPEEVDGVGRRECTKCYDSWKPARAHHCRVCNRCVFRMDHHCPWVNNCVGFGNQKLFVLFMAYVSMAAVTTLLVHVWGFYRWYVYAFTSWSGRRWKAPPSPYLAFGLQIVVVLECAGFLAFVAPFLSDQYEAVVTNSTLVETFQETHGVRTTFHEHLKQVMGEDWRWWWVPVPSGVIPDYLEPVIPDREEVVKTEFISPMPRSVKEEDGHRTESSVMKEEGGIRQRF
jgi:hypothetical protein